MITGKYISSRGFDGGWSPVSSHIFVLVIGQLQQRQTSVLCAVSYIYPL